MNFNKSDPTRYKAEVYAALHRAIEIMDKPTKAFVFGLQTVRPEAWNDLAGIAFNYGTHAAIKAVSFALELLSGSQQRNIRTEGYLYMARTNKH